MPDKQEPGASQDEAKSEKHHPNRRASGWDRLVERLREAGGPFAGWLAALRDELVALESWLEPPVTLQTCHRDLWADNVLPTAQGGVCVIDWENSGPATVARPGHFSMLIAQLGHIAEIAATDWLEPNMLNPDRAAAAAWIGDILDEPHTREVLGALLNVASGTARPMPPRLRRRRCHPRRA